jgi:hypothetical protein
MPVVFTQIDTEAAVKCQCWWGCYTPLASSVTIYAKTTVDYSPDSSLFVNVACIS